MGRRARVEGVWKGYAGIPEPMGERGPRSETPMWKRATLLDSEEALDAALTMEPSPSDTLGLQVLEDLARLASTARASSCRACRRSRLPNLFRPESQ